MNNYQTAIVTGASSGIGRALTQQLCAQGVTVYALARSKRNLELAKNSLPKVYRNLLIPVVCDISKTEETQVKIKEIFSCSQIYLVINNAGIGYSRNFVDYSDNEIDTVIATNLRGTITVIQACLKLRDKQRPIHFVNTTSLAGKMGFPELSVYAATKFAIEGLTESLRHEYMNKDVTFTIVRPGITDTAFFSKAGMQLYKEGVKELKSFYSAEQVATILLAKLHSRKSVIIVGNDKFYIPLLPFVPFKYRFKVLDIVNKL
ncbi:MAG: SDR family NAD(P)-dependent oxidoreductase [Patescibacteria group bacterium]|nr:SDR family NAD(P)-dependent oxidoreductase [Patescibacteria group bacterium]